MVKMVKLAGSITLWLTSSFSLWGAAMGEVLGPPRGGWEPLPDDQQAGVEDEVLTIVIGLPIKLGEGILKKFDSDHDDFRNFHTIEESRKIATEGIEDCREAFLAEAVALGLNTTNKTMHHEYFDVEGTGRDILNLFNNGTLKLLRFAHELEKETIVRAVFESEADLLDLVKKTELQTCIGVVLGLINFPLVRRTPVRKEYLPAGNENRDRRLATCSKVSPSPNSITPEVLYKMYSVPSESVGVSPENDFFMAVYESTSVKVSESDLQCFNDAMSLEDDSLTPGTYEKYNTDSCNDTASSCGEPNLDVQYMSGMNQGVDVAYGAWPSIGDMIVALLSYPDDKLPYVMSISWAEPESKFDSSLKQLCTEIATLSARGMTFFASTGDQGATNSKNGCGTKYNVNFPASCPYVTAVGATTGFKAGDEVVCNGNPSVITSGGGFSSIYTAANGFDLDFQKTQVDAYRGKLSESMTGYPSGGRGLPDISAPGTNYIVEYDAKPAGMDGTSCSCPVMAAITGRIMLANNSTRFGWINPILYKNEDIFFDVTSGQNSGVGKGKYCPAGSTTSYMGFAALDGWDAATGLGTLGTAGGYDKYEAVLMNAPLPTPSPTTQAPSSSPLPPTPLPTPSPTTQAPSSSPLPPTTQAPSGAIHAALPCFGVLGALLASCAAMQ